MDRRRRAYRPGVVGTLEDRLVPGAAVVGPAVFEQGPQMRPFAVATFAGSARPEVVAHGGDAGGLSVSAEEFATQAPDGTPVGVFEVDYDNGSSKAITSATIEDALGPRLAYLPAGSDVPVDGDDTSDAIVQVSHDFSYFPSGSHVPPGGQLSVTTGARGSQVVELKLPGGIAPGAHGFLEFEARAVTPRQ